MAHSRELININLQVWDNLVCLCWGRIRFSISRWSVNLRIWIEIYFREHDITTKIQWDLRLQKQKYKQHSVNGRD